MRSSGQKAPLRLLDQPNADPYYAALEKELLDAINATGFARRALAVQNHLPWAFVSNSCPPWACLPVAVNVSHCVTRRASAEV